ncbi:hypothetical protein GIB67_042145 [Kingdonia uniflora]|uniref:Calcium-dependent protein kinase n=1 Tax=Kingdonia uniflora TaxID=39325 RepID=A0A7J7NPI4_9MAGN|nr:hypothetical protein GIB67_042145 [Kingdonia uniflora]
MGNYCVRPPVVQSDDQQRKKGKKKANPFSVDYGLNNGGGGRKLLVLSDPTGRDIGISYELGKELGRGEFRITYLCIGDTFAYKSTSKKKLRTVVDIEDVRREVEVMKHLPPHPNIVRLKDTYEDEVAVHLVIELCKGGELYDRIVMRGNYTKRAAAVVTKTIVEVVQVCLLSSVGAEHLSVEEVAGIKESFQMMDVNNNGKITLGERLDSLHSNRIIHRGMKPQNILIGAGYILKLCYIGFFSVTPFYFILFRDAILCIST